MGAPGPGTAALRNGLRALECRRRQHADVGLQSYGGRIADDAGTTVTIDSEETRAYHGVGDRRLRRRSLPARRNDLGRRRRQHGLSSPARRSSSPTPAACTLQRRGR